MMSATVINPAGAKTLSSTGSGTIKRTREKLGSRSATIAAIVIAAVWTIPTFGLLLTSFRPPSDIMTTGWWTVFTHPSFTLSNYSQTLTLNAGVKVTQAVINSLTITLPATVIPLAIASLAAYALSWIDFKGRDFLYIGIFALQIVPIQMVLVPLLTMYSSGVHIGDIALFSGLNAGAGNTSFARVWISHTIFAMPLAVFILTNSISAIPHDLIEAANMDGAGHGQIFLRIVLPLAMPAIAAQAIFQFLWVWNDLLVATIFASGLNAPINEVLNNMQGNYNQQWYLLSAGTFIAIIVPLIVFFALQRFFVRGLLAGATKG